MTKEVCARCGGPVLSPDGKTETMMLGVHEVYHTGCIIGQVENAEGNPLDARCPACGGPTEQQAYAYNRDRVCVACCTTNGVP